MSGTLGDLIAELNDYGPDTPVDPREPGYALALLVDIASRDLAEGEYVRGLGERVFAALGEAEAAVVRVRHALDTAAADATNTYLLSRTRYGEGYADGAEFAETRALRALEAP